MRVALLMALTLTACGAAPTEQELISAIEAGASIDPVDPSCTNVTGDPRDASLGAIYAHLRAQADAAELEGAAVHRTARCEATSSGPAHCLFEIAIEADDPWRYGIELTMTNGAIDPASIRCPGGS